MYTVTSRQFNQFTNEVQKTAQQQPVLVTKHGRPSYVLLNYDDYVYLGGYAHNPLVLLDDVDEDAADWCLDLPPRFQAA